METYYAIIADIINSRKMEISYRTEVQKKLIKEVNELNSVYDEQLASYIDLTSGDQIEALFFTIHDAYNFICRLRTDMYPVLFRYGIGAGSWTIRIIEETSMKKLSSNVQDGTAFHHARIAIENADHSLENQIIFFSGNELDNFINQLISDNTQIFFEKAEMQK